MIPVVGVRFTKAGRIYYFDPGDWQLEVGMRVIVETSQGLECGEIVVGTKLVPEEDVVQPLRRILRIATEEDLRGMSEARRHEKEAFAIACERVKRLALEMKIVDAEWTFDHQKLVFYFTADERVDFRELVKELASTFRTRIELRQIGVRDQSKMLGGYGVCGRPLCCATWISSFEPISIRHAKEQDLSLNPSKISGVCGRLKCCLRFEADTYREIRQRMPKVGTMVLTPRGLGKVVELHVIKERVTVVFDEGDEMRRMEFPLDQIRPTPEGLDGTALAEFAASWQPEAAEPDEIPEELLAEDEDAAALSALLDEPVAVSAPTAPAGERAEGAKASDRQGKRRHHRRDRRQRRSQHAGRKAGEGEASQ